MAEQHWALFMQEDIVNALALTGQILMGQAVMVKSSEVSPNPPCSTLEQSMLSDVKCF